jgi:hypothetical protein
MSTLYDFVSFILYLIIVALLSYLWATIETTTSILKAFNKNAPLTSTDEENTPMYTLTGTKAEIESNKLPTSPLTKPELVNVTQTSTKKEGGK